MSYAENHITPLVVDWVLAELGVSKMPRNVKADMNIFSKMDIFYALRRMEIVLRPRTYLVGDRISLADLVLFTAFIPMYEHVFDSQFRKQYVNMNRWFFTILNQPQVKRVLITFKFCDYFKEIKAQYR